MQQPAMILLVDDEIVVRRVIGDGLAATGYLVERAANHREAIELVQRCPIDLVVLDLRLGEDDGIAVLNELRQFRPNLPVIILTAHGSMGSAIEALRQHAADYLLKPVSLGDLRERIAAILEATKRHQQQSSAIRQIYAQLPDLVGEDEPNKAAELPTPASTAIYLLGPLRLDVQQHAVWMADQPVDLTPTEFAVLHELVRRPGVVHTCAQLVAASQHIELEEEEARTLIRPHIVRLRRKVETNPQQPLYIQSVRGIGYRWGVPEEGLLHDEAGGL